MKILMLVNWNVQKVNIEPENQQPSNYCVKGKKYWFFNHIEEDVQIDVIGVKNNWISRLEKKILRFYVIQTIKVLLKLRKYDVVISHGAQSGIFLSFIRRFFKGKYKHILIDVGAFNSASEKNTLKDKIIKFSSKSIDYVIYHESNQKKYYEKYYPWLIEKSKFISYGADIDFFIKKTENKNFIENKYLLCVGYSKRDWETLINAYELVKTDYKLILLGKKIKTNDSRIQSIDFVDVNTMISYIKNSSFCILPLKNYNYSFGQMTFLQQCLLEKTVIVSKVNSMIDYGIDNETCVFYESENKKDLADKISDLLINEEKCKKIGKQAKIYVCKNISDRKMANEIYKTVKEVVYNEKK